MRVVIDTNVLVSAILKDRDPEVVILFIVGHNEMEWIVSPEILMEYREVLARPKFGLPAETLRAWLDMLNRYTITWTTDLKIDFPRDRKDAKFLSCAMAAGAEYLITGDRDFSGMQRVLSTTIISVSQFKKLVCEKLK